MRVPKLSDLTALLISALLAADIAAQEPPPAPLPEVPSSQPAPDISAFEKEMTLEEAVSEAYQLIKVAEARGEEAPAAMKRLDSLAGFIRAKDPLNPDADFLFGRMHLLLRRPREALQYIERYATSRKGSNDWEAFRFWGDLTLEAKYNAMALDKYRRATELSPSQPAPYAGMAKAELMRGRYAVASEHARKAVDLDASKPPEEREPEYHSVLAEALLGLQKLDEATAAASQAVELGRARAMKDPADGTLLEKLDAHYALLERVVRSMLRSFPERTEEYVRFARLLRERADLNHLLRYHNVLVSIQGGIERASPNPPIPLLLEQVKLLIAVGDLAKAQSVINDVLAREPENAEAQQLQSQVALR